MVLLMRDEVTDEASEWVNSTAAASFGGYAHPLYSQDDALLGSVTLHRMPRRYLLSALLLQDTWLLFVLLRCFLKFSSTCDARQLMTYCAWTYHSVGSLHGLYGSLRACY